MSSPQPSPTLTRTFTADNLKHFDYLQAIITRMNSNSFMIKGWTITIVSALLAFAANANDLTYLCIIALPVFIFWTLDTTYLFQEKKFRFLFNLAKMDNSDIKPYDLNLEHEQVKAKLKEEKISYWSVLCSKTIFRFYFSIICLTIVLALFIHSKPTQVKTPVNVCIIDTVKIKEAK